MLSFRKRKEEDEEGEVTTTKKRRSILCGIGAVGSMITFLLTTGFKGIAVANWWTLLVLAFAGVAVYGFIERNKEEQQNENTGI